MYKAEDIDAFNKAERLVADGGFGHTSSIYLNAVTEQAKLDAFAANEDLPSCQHSLLTRRYR